MTSEETHSRTNEELRNKTIKHLLPRTWLPFFGRFGKLLEVQNESIPKVLQGKNLVVCSPTASGKTEALLAPLTEKLLARGWEGLSLLWISPTRALVNDLSARFTHPLGTLDIPFARKTGDHPEFKPDRPVPVLITTPESFDSVISRHPAVFETLNAIVLDDIHLLDGTCRGDQVRVLLDRLRRIAREEVSTYLLSATIENPGIWGVGICNILISSGSRRPRTSIIHFCQPRIRSSTL